jgi:Domain of unknown function (DUF4258)
MEKPIFFSNHAKQQMLLRGAKTEEVIVTINSGGRLDAKGKYKARYEFPFGETSPQNEEFYQYKRIEAIFAEDRDRIVVITVKVYYYN